MELCSVAGQVDTVWLVLSGYPSHLVYHQRYFRPLDQLDLQLENIEAMGNLEYWDK